MPRALRIQYPGAIYHVMNRGDRREPIFRDVLDHKKFLTTLAEVCTKPDLAWPLAFIKPDVVTVGSGFILVRSDAENRTVRAGNASAGLFKQTLPLAKVSTSLDRVHRGGGKDDSRPAKGAASQRQRRGFPCTGKSVPSQGQAFP